MAKPLFSLFSFLFLIIGVSAQFQFFEQMFNGQQQQQQRQPQDVPSDSQWYQDNYDRGNNVLPISSPPSTPISPFPKTNIPLPLAHCTSYLCPGTLSCVAFPHHCPCAHPTYEEKFELADGNAICISKGGFKAGEAARKVELARKGLI
ncbi:hypothetical protein BELL_0438g00030 [Botrytis elliptica]|uniref:Long chronological lifespan protein 2 n=1 Tax=Botrytis elliptica TaxID=278938 RepID=A0A4Z1JFY8_9HELO|nr:hypothetical protein BELL_0438g00030 [Botrytis elliptica]